MAPPVILIDADIWLYQVSSTCEQAIEWDEGQWTFTADEGYMEEMFSDMTAKVVDYLYRARDPAEIIHVISAQVPTFRHELLPSYKSNRKAVRKPVGFKALRDNIIENQETVVVPGIEADDTLGILATRYRRRGRRAIVVSPDKDLLTIPGELIRDIDNPKVIKINEEQAHYAFMFQTLTGDSTDCYKGCPGIGPKKANDILQSLPPDHWWEAVVETFEDQGETINDAILQARMARILREKDYDFENNEPRLWLPDHVEV